MRQISSAVLGAQHMPVDPRPGSGLQLHQSATRARLTCQPESCSAVADAWLSTLGGCLTPHLSRSQDSLPATTVGSNPLTAGAR